MSTQNVLEGGKFFWRVALPYFSDDFDAFNHGLKPLNEFPSVIWRQGLQLSVDPGRLSFLAQQQPFCCCFKSFCIYFCAFSIELVLPVFVGNIGGYTPTVYFAAELAEW